MSDILNRLAAEYRRLAHAVQSGVAVFMGIDGRDTEPKHLRTGINIAMCDHAALIKILIEKKIITDEEYHQALVDQLGREKADYEERLSKHFGKKITLG